MRRRSTYSSDSVKRDAIAIAKLSLLLSPPRIPTALSLYNSLLPVEDNRSFHPAGPYRRPRSIARASDTGVTLSKSTRPGDVFRFNVPENVVTCIRRSARREVLFAKHKTGKGARSPKRYRYNSTISCKR